MKTVKVLSLALTYCLGFTAAARAGDDRGRVEVPVAAAKAVVAGPIAIHAYSAFSGAKLFAIDAGAATDRPCEAAARSIAGTALSADKVETVTVGAGQILCVASTGSGHIELLWHARKDAHGPAGAPNGQNKSLVVATRSK
jgi:hypothetical protein